MLEVRLGRDPADTQITISGLLSVHGLATLIAAPVLAALLDRAPNGKTPFLLALTSCVVGTVLVAATPSCTSMQRSCFSIHALTQKGEGFLGPST